LVPVMMPTAEKSRPDEAWAQRCANDFCEHIEDRYRVELTPSP
jgi:hypothetical protein